MKISTVCGKVVGDVIEGVSPLTCNRAPEHEGPCGIVLDIEKAARMLGCEDVLPKTGL